MIVDFCKSGLALILIISVADAVRAQSQGRVLSTPLGVPPVDDFAGSESITYGGILPAPQGERDDVPAPEGRPMVEQEKSGTMPESKDAFNSFSGEDLMRMKDAVTAVRDSIEAINDNLSEKQRWLELADDLASGVDDLADRSDQANGAEERTPVQFDEVSLAARALERGLATSLSDGIPSDYFGAVRRAKQVLMQELLVLIEPLELEAGISPPSIDSALGISRRSYLDQQPGEVYPEQLRYSYRPPTTRSYRYGSLPVLPSRGVQFELNIGSVNGHYGYRSDIYAPYSSLRIPYGGYLPGPAIGVTPGVSIGLYGRPLTPWPVAPMFPLGPAWFW